MIRQGRRPSVRSVAASLLVAMLHAVSADASLGINEFMASNSNFLKDPQGQYDDWVEIHNPDRWPVDLAGMYLTDDLSAPTKWRFPADQPQLTSIQRDGYLVIWLDGDVADTGLHASFALDSMGDQIALFDADGTLVDLVNFDEQRPNITYGRPVSAPETWGHLVVPTPGGPNTAAYEGMLGEMEFSRSRGFYTEPFAVTITAGTPDALVFYTTDGSSPLDNDRGIPTGRPYTGPIPVSTTTCLRAVAFKPDWIPSNVNTQTYLFLDDVIRQPSNPPGWPTNWGHTSTGDYEMDPDVVDDPRYRDTIRDDLQSVATLSLATDRDNWFGSNGQGIYLRGELDERPVSAELIAPGEEEGFQINCAVMIVGGSSTGRWKMDKLSIL